MQDETASIRSAIEFYLHCWYINRATGRPEVIESARSAACGERRERRRNHRELSFLFLFLLLSCSQFHFLAQRHHFIEPRISEYWSVQTRGSLAGGPYQP
jgi:hypothetical protein